MKYSVAFSINEHLLTEESKSRLNEITSVIWNVSVSACKNKAGRINKAIRTELQKQGWAKYPFSDGRESDFYKGDVILEVQLTGYPQVDLSKLRVALRGDYTRGTTEIRSKFNCAVIVMPSNALAEKIKASPNYEVTISGMEADASRYADTYQGCITVYLLYDYKDPDQQIESTSQEVPDSPVEQPILQRDPPIPTTSLGSQVPSQSSLTATWDKLAQTIQAVLDADAKAMQEAQNTIAYVQLVEQEIRELLDMQSTQAIQEKVTHIKSMVREAQNYAARSKDHTKSAQNYAKEVEDVIQSIGDIDGTDRDFLGSTK